MDEINYRRLTALPKRRCEDCGATAYTDPAGVYRCVVCDHTHFEICLDCGHLTGWCECPPPPTTTSTRKRTRSRAKAKK